MKTIILPIALALACIAGGAASANQKPIPVAALPAPDNAATASAQAQDYRIGPFDTLDVAVFGFETLTRTVQVGADGQIMYPLIGPVPVGGLTPRDAAAEIARRLDARYMKNPQVTLAVKQSNSQKFTVEGAVHSPGVFPIQGRLTLLQAIATAQGVDKGAKLKTVVIFRTVNQKRAAGVIDLAQVRLGKADDPQIYPGDIVVVPQSPTRKALDDIIGVSPIIYLLAAIHP